MRSKECWPKVVGAELFGDKMGPTRSYLYSTRVDNRLSGYHEHSRPFLNRFRINPGTNRGFFAFIVNRGHG